MEELLGASRPSNAPSPKEGPIKQRVVVFLAESRRWSTAQEIAEGTDLEIRQVEICLRNGKAKTGLFDLDAGQWLLSPKGYEFYQEISQPRRAP